MKVFCVVIGAGLAGATIAERIATELHRDVLLIEKRGHIGGNTFDCYDQHGVMIQQYGPHIFHTNLKHVWDYLCRFTDWNRYEHKVIARLGEKEIYLPITIESLEALYGGTFSAESMQAFLEQRRLPLNEVKNSRDVVVSQVGEELYDLFFKNYTKKQWGVYPHELEAEVTKRLPVRFNRDTRYFADAYQGIPAHGYTKIFENMLDNKNINIMLNTDYKDVIDSIDYEVLVYTGPVDYFFDYKYGKLPYRSLEFEFVHLAQEKFQNAAVVNYPNEHEYTRITESKQFYFQNHPGTTICYEYPRADGDPYYPIPSSECRKIYKPYEQMAQATESVHFVGRLAQYRYMNMDEVVAESLEVFNQIAQKQRG